MSSSPPPSASTRLVAFARRQARAWDVWLLSALVAVCAFRAYLYYYPDEHGAVIEFMSVKLGWTRPTEMEWEYGRGIRPWLLPGAYYALASCLRLVGVDARFGIVTVLRLATGALCVVALVRLARWSAATASEKGASATFAREAMLLTFLPYWFTRTSAETVSGALLAFAWLAYFPRSGPAPHAPLGGLRALAAGLLFGLAFDVRPHTAAFAGGLLLWSLVHERRGLRHWLLVGLGAVSAVAILIVVDRWGYGRWGVSPYGYFVANMVEGVAKRFGTSPFYAYSYLLLQNPFAPLALYCELVTIVAVVRNPRQPLVWAVAAFVLAHSAIGHKEDRFLFPIFPFLVILFPLAFRPSTTAAGPVRGLRALRRFGALGHAAGAVALGYMFFVAYGNCNTGTARAIERSARPDDPVLVVEGGERPFARQHYYERAPWTVIHETDAVPASLASQPIVHLVADDVPLPSGACPSANLHGACVRRWSEFPGEDYDSHNRWLAFFESIQEGLRVRFAPSSKPHPSWYAVYDFYPSPAPSPGKDLDATGGG